MDRRVFLQAAAAFTAGHWLAGCAGRPRPAASAADWTLGWQGIDVDRLPPATMRVEGKLPQAVHGSLFRNGPARIERAGIRYRHWFDGDGMIQHFRLGPDGATHEARFVGTEKYRSEQAAGRFLYGGAGTALPDERPSRNNDTANVANTALLPWGDELLALWEGGSAHRVDPTDLSTIGRKDWRDDLVHMPFSAHPLVEPDGSMWNFGAAPYAGRNGTLVVYRISPRSGVQQAHVLELPVASYMHSFAMTRRHLVFYLSPHRFRRGAETFVDSFEWTPELGSRVLVVDKDDLSSQRWFEAPAGFVFHFAHAFEAGRDIVARMALYPTADVMSRGMRELMRADANSAYPDYPRARLASLRLGLASGRARVEETDTLIEFPGVDGRRRDTAAPVFGVGHDASGAPAHSDSVVRVDPDSGRVARYAFPPQQVVEEPLFVPERGTSSAGWLVGTFLDYARRHTGVYVLDADDLAAGPVALATMERHVPLGFHGCFVPHA